MARPTGTTAMRQYGIDTCDSQSAYYTKACSLFRQFGEVLCAMQAHNLHRRDGFQQACFAEASYNELMPLAARLNRRMISRQ